MMFDRLIERISREGLGTKALSCNWPPLLFWWLACRLVINIGRRKPAWCGWFEGFWPRDHNPAINAFNPSSATNCEALAGENHLRLRWCFSGQLRLSSVT